MGRGAALDLMTDPGAKPRIPGLFLGDLSGALYAVIGILAALVHRTRTGRGQYVDVGMLDAVLGLHTFLAARHLIAGLPADHTMPPMFEAVPCYQIYECRDGKFATLGALEEHFWRTFCTVVERADLIARQWDPTAVPELQAIFKQRDRDEWVALSGEHDFCCEPVLSLGEALHDPHTLARGMIVETEDPGGGRVRHVGSPIVFGRARSTVRLPAPQVGQHTVEILREAGIPQAEIDRLLADGILAITEPTRGETTSPSQH